MSDPVLEVEDLTVQFGSVTAVNKLNLQVEPGTMVGLIGTNGAGKTTALDALTGFVKASGSARYKGQELLGLPAHKRAKLGMVRTWQSLELFDDLTVRENVLVGSDTRSRGDWQRFLPWGGNKGDNAWMEVLESGGIAEFAEKRPTELSQGQRKLVVLARALAMQPELLLADEPAAGLDTEESLWLGGKLRARVDNGLSMVLVEHDMGLVLGICDYIYVLDQGLLIAEGTPAEIKSNPVVLDAYLGKSAGA